MIAIDPGFGKTSRGCACARFVDGRLRAVWFTRPDRVAAPAEARAGGLPAPTLIVWELPQDDSRSAGKASTLIRLAAEGGTLAGLLAGRAGARVRAVPAGEWTAGAPKPVRHGRLWRVLDADERGLLGGGPTGDAIEAAKVAGALERWARPGVAYYPARFNAHNLLDAVGLGVWVLGRDA